ncbi:MAG: hypothetical protein ACFFAN_09785 [Promethearchaeota archaeon]
MSEKIIERKNFLLIQIFRVILFGFLVWFVPALVATLFWDVSTNKSIIEMIWFNSLMGFVWSLNFALFAFIYFNGIKKNYSEHGLIAGIIWYIMCVILDFIVVVLILNLGIIAFLPAVLVYINNFILATMIGYLLNKKNQNE